MNIARAKARQFIKDNRFVLLGYCDLEKVDTEALESALMLFAKQQDRDTRRACAEAVIQQAPVFEANGNACHDKYGDIVDKCICADAAHNAIMNVKAV